MGEIDTCNKFFVGGNRKEIFILKFGVQLSYADARNLGAWLAVVSSEPHESFDAVLDAVRNT